ncbi:MAG: DUF3048 domain-containing protein [Chloroflexota bacterium]|nr:DUF3048 domain-containing protein [Chloroflexota bacterium]
MGTPAQNGRPALPPEKAPRRPLMIMVENHPDARPQTGLDKADIVYEAPAEYGIPRFLAIYITRDAKVVGPVRSTRTYYVAWAKEYDGLYLHAGGSPMGLSWIRQLKLDSIDALRYSSNAYWRDTSRVAPHNLYTNTTQLRKTIAKDKNLQHHKGSWGGIHRSNKPTVGTAEGTEVKITYNNAYNVTYFYDAKSGVYKREMLDEPHKDRETKRQYTASAVVVQSISMWLIKGDEKGRIEAQVQADKKPVLVFQNGRVIKGYWSKDKRDTPTEYTTRDGKPILFKRGPIWIQMVPVKGTKIEY